MDFGHGRPCLALGLALLAWSVAGPAWTQQEASPAAAGAEAQPEPEAAADGEPADPPAPPTEVGVTDRVDDAGDGLVVEWGLSPDDVAGQTPPRVVRYEIRRRIEGEDEFRPIGEATAGQISMEDEQAEIGRRHWYQVVAIGPEGEMSPPAETPDGAVPEMEFFKRDRGWLAILVLIVGGSVVYYIRSARSGRELRLRKIAGLEAVDEAVGRATEMGRSCLFIPGIQDINDIQTVAAITILSRVARRTAEYDAELEVPTARSLVMTTSRETVQSAYLGAGRPDAYKEDNIYYLTDEQFGYVAGVTGTMVRKRPAACFYMGAFYAESLLLAETGNSIGAIQVAGTAMPSQLPFFVAACDYTLIGEEFFAASAYLSGEPHQLGSLKGQDFGKVVGVALLVTGCLLATILSFVASPDLESALVYLRDHIVGERGFLP
jgi:hypothetical protein